METKDKIFLVTGSASGIGFAISCELIAQESKVIGFDIQPNELLLHSHYQHFIVDVTDEGAICLALHHALGKNNKLAGIINLAGVSGANQSITSCPPTEFKRIFDCNLFGTYNVCYYGVKYMDLLQPGCIINTSSLFALKSMQNFIAYNASKKAIISLTETLAKELAPMIRVNAIAPGFIDTPMTKSNPNYDKMIEMVVKTYPLQKVGNTHHVVDAILFLIRNDFMTGETIAITGGAHL